MPAGRPTTAVERLKATVLDLMSLVKAADPGPLARVPSPGEWSAAMVVAHLAHAEQVWGVRARMILTSHRPFLTSYDENGWVTRLAALEADPRESLQRWRPLREANVALFETLTDVEWGREGVHDERGTITLAEVAATLVDHDRAHLDQIRRALAG